MMCEYQFFLLVSVIFFMQTPVNSLSTIPTNEQDFNLQVNTTNGLLQGKIIYNNNLNLSYYGFFGIPYAKPPIGNLRFRSPRFSPNWTGILDARNERSKCMQIGGGSENCLFLNIYTPTIEKSQNFTQYLPVMFLIHGGAFIIGSGNFTIQGPDYILEQNVIMVAINYRLSVYGFLSTEDMSSPGNYGLKDQLQALKWIKQNIHFFGGNSSEITIFGRSAGGASVQYLIQTPLSKNLFQKAISESGSSLCTWALTQNPKKIAFRIGEALGIVTNNTQILVDKLRKLDNEKLNSMATWLIFEDSTNTFDGLPFSPTMEPRHKNAILSEKSHSVLSSGRFQKVPYLLGYVSQESEMFSFAMDYLTTMLSNIESDVSYLVHQSLNIFNKTIKDEVGKKIKKFYFGDSTINNISTDKIFDFVSDDQFIRPVYESAKLHSQVVPVFMYRFSYRSPDSPLQGVGHAEDQKYFFYNRKTENANVNSNIRNKVLKLWTNFAKVGNPTPTKEELLENTIWPLFKSLNTSDVNYIEIGASLLVNINPRYDAINFWKKLYETYGQPPFSTY